MGEAEFASDGLDDGGVVVEADGGVMIGGGVAFEDEVAGRGVDQGVVFGVVLHGGGVEQREAPCGHLAGGFDVDELVLGAAGFDGGQVAAGRSVSAAAVSANTRSKAGTMRPGRAARTRRAAESGGGGGGLEGGLGMMLEKRASR